MKCKVFYVLYRRAGKLYQTAGNQRAKGALINAQDVVTNPDGAVIYEAPESSDLTDDSFEYFSR